MKKIKLLISVSLNDYVLYQINCILHKIKKMFISNKSQYVYALYTISFDPYVDELD